MGFNGFLGIANGKINGMSIMDIATGLKGKKSSGGKPPVDNSHSHGSSGNTSTMTAGDSVNPVSNTPADLPEPGFMGKGQVEQFSGLTDASSVDRGGRAMSSDSLDPVGIKPAMNPPMATPETPPGNQSTELEGMYSRGMAKINLPKKSGTYNDSAYGKKATDRVKHKINKK